MGVYGAQQRKIRPQGIDYNHFQVDSQRVEDPSTLMHVVIREICEQEEGMLQPFKLNL